MMTRIIRIKSNKRNRTVKRRKGHDKRRRKIG